MTLDCFLIIIVMITISKGRGMQDNIRMTKQRRVILEELRRVTVHPTADEIYESVKKKMPGISLGTVYRNLELLCRTGTVRRIEQGGSPMRYDGDLSLHDHIRCIRCGRIDDIRATCFESGLKEKEISISGYRAVQVRIDMSGICPDCQKADDHGDEGGAESL